MKQRIFLGCVAAGTLAAGLGVTACGGTTTSQGAAATATATPTATGESRAIAGIPFYQPSHVVNHTSRSALLTSPDSVTTVSDYYVKVVERDGWTTVSKSITHYSGNLTIKKSGEGASISVAPSGSGSRISIAAYPTG